MKGEESSSKAEQGSKAKEAEHPISRCQNFRTPDFKVRNFRTPLPQCAKSLGQKKPFSHTPTSRCEINFKVRNPFSRCEFPKIQFRTPLWKVQTLSLAERHDMIPSQIGHLHGFEQQPLLSSLLPCLAGTRTSNYDITH